MGRVFPGRALLVPAVLVGCAAALAAQPASAPPAQPASQVTGPRGTVMTPAAATGTAVLRGTVVAADTGTPVRRALVRAMSAEPPDNGVATTDEQGRFEIANLAGGRYSVSVSKAGFLSVNYGQRRPNERGTPVEVAPGATIEKLMVGLPRGGVITGRVTDETGEPLADARVQVLRSQYVPGGRRMLPIGRGDTTDDQGTFRIFGVVPGDYVVSAATRGEMFTAMGPGGKPLAMPDDTQGYAPTYYPGTPSAADAQRISVAAGQEVSGIAFGMVPTRVSRVSGRIVGGKAADIEESFISVMADDSAGGMTSAGGGTVVQRDGSFTVNGLAPGRYILRAQPRAIPDATLVGMTTVTVAGVDLDNVLIALQKPGEVTGRIEFEGGTPQGISPGQIRVQAMPTEPMTRSFMTAPPRTNDDLTFSIKGATGPTLFRTSAAPGWYLKAVELDGDDVTDTPVTLELGRDIHGVRIVLTQTASSVVGVVRDDRGNAVLDALVVIFPADETRWTTPSRFLRITRPGTDGAFTIRGLPASPQYRIIAVQGVEDMQAYDPEFLATIRDRADSLALAPGEAKTLDVKLR